MSRVVCFKTHNASGRLKDVVVFLHKSWGISEIPPFLFNKKNGALDNAITGFCRILL